ncbi:DUF92 domain-containing protein [Bacillus sp. 2205SS5-2]|uniref:DUF92 domain-containing protein n=1 Tax=Bacillus sp. 2205SS5-2 TaxID=3109031 RepID=UPI003005A184
MNEGMVVYWLIIIMTALGGFFTKSLKLSGAIGAIVIGVVILEAFQWHGLVVVGSFFASSSIWSKYKYKDKQKLEQKLAKSAQRDWQQVVANGGAAALFSICFILLQNEVLFYAFLAAVSGANSDTWASEIGTLSKKKPLSLIRFKEVEKGTSGAVSILGTIAGLAGSFFIVMVIWLLEPDLPTTSLLLVGVAGFFGNLLDTILGAYVQAEYTCNICELKTELTSHCLKKTTLSKGVSWINNEVVNFTSSVISGLLIILSQFLLL